MTKGKFQPSHLRNLILLEDENELKVGNFTMSAASSSSSDMEVDEEGIG